MKQYILKAGSTFYNSIKSPLGLAVTGAIAGSTTSYFFDRTKLAQDLVHAERDKQQLEERILQLEGVNSDLSQQNRKFAETMIDYEITGNRLRDELRNLSTAHAAVKDDLNKCNKSIRFFGSAINNELFSDKNNVNNNREKVALDRSDVAVSLSKKQ